MTITTNIITISSAALLVGLVIVGGILAGPAFGAGALLAGGLMLANLVAWRFSISKARALVTEASTPDLAAASLPGGLFVLKFLVLGGAVAALVAWFPPVSVALGLSVVVITILGFAALGLVVDLQVGES